MELIGVSEAQYIFDFIIVFNYCRCKPNLKKKTQKNAVFRCRSVKKGPNDVQPCETFDLLHKELFGRNFWLILAKFLVLATIKIYKGLFYMRSCYNYPRPQLCSMSFLIQVFLLQIKACRAYSRNLGQRSVLAKKGTYL